MFDFSSTAILLGFVRAIGAVLSPVALYALTAAIIIALAAFMTPARRLILFALAASLAAFAVFWDAGVAEGARRELVRTHALALQAERARADLAESLTRDLAEQATQDLAAEQAGAVTLKDLTDALAQDPRRAGACVPRDLARRLRAL